MTTKIFYPDSAILAILNDQDEIVGTGFLVRENLALTCAHVVQDAGHSAGQSITIRYHKTGDVRVAQVLDEYWNLSEDIAVLSLNDNSPPEITPLPLGYSGDSAGHKFYSLGYPEIGDFLGNRSSGTIEGTVDKEGGSQRIQLTSTQLSQGHSGAPVWDEKQRRVIGMISEVFLAKSDAKNIFTAYAIPTEALKKLIPILELSPLCPYLGLDSFDENNAEFFYGRENIVRKLLQNIKEESRFLAVLGPSGSGKSSLVRAGFIPALRRGEVPNSEDWYILTIRPKDNPIRELSDALSLEISENLNVALDSWLTKNSQYHRFVLVIDQFEELFTLSPSSLQTAFLNQLVKILNSKIPFSLVLTLRDDFYGAFARQIPEILPWLERGLVNIPLVLSTDEIHAVIVEPANKIGLSFESGLPKEIMDDVLSANPDNTLGQSAILPLLEFSLTQLWRLRRDGILTLDGYQKIGRVSGSLTQWANQSYYELSEKQKDIAKRIFTDLIYLGNESQNIPDSRRRMSIKELCRNDGEFEAVRSLVHMLADDRLLVISGDEKVEIIHDTLVREWGLLRSWIKENRQFLTWRQGVEARVQSWIESIQDDDSSRDEDKLLRGRDLLEAEEWQRKFSDNLNEREKEFIQASASQQQRERNLRRSQRRRVFASVAIVSLVITTIVISWALSNAKNNKILEEQIATIQAASTAVAEQKSIADDRARIAKIRELLASSSSLLEINPELSFLLVREALKLNTNHELDFEIEKNLYQILSETPYREGWPIGNSLDSVNVSISSNSSKTLFLFSGLDCKVTLWEVSGNLIKSFMVDAAHFSPDGKNIITSSTHRECTGDGMSVSTFMGTTIAMWDINGNELWNITISNQFLDHDVYQTGFLSDNLVFATTGNRFSDDNDNGIIYIWNDVGELVQEVAAYSEAVYRLKINPNKDTFMTLGCESNKTTNSFQSSPCTDFQIKLWDANFNLLSIIDDPNALMAVFTPQDDKILTARCEGDQFISFCDGQMIISLWDFSGHLIQEINTELSNFSSIEFSKDGKYFLTFGGSADLVLWSIKGEKITDFSSSIDSGIVGAAFSHNENELVTMSVWGEARIWNFAGELLKSIKAHDSALNTGDLIFVSNQNLLTVGLDNETFNVKLWDIEGTLKINPPPGLWFLDTVFSPNGNRILVIATENDIFSYSSNPDQAEIDDFSTMGLLWDADGNLIRSLELNDKLLFMAEFSESGNEIITLACKPNLDIETTCVYQNWDSDGYFLGDIIDSAFPFSWSSSSDGEVGIFGKTNTLGTYFDDSSNTDSLDLSITTFYIELSDFVTNELGISEDEVEITISQDGEKIVLAICESQNASGLCEYHHQKLFNISFNLIAELGVFRENPIQIKFNSDGSKIASVLCTEYSAEIDCLETKVLLWDGFGQLITELETKDIGPIRNIHFSPDSIHLFVSTNENKIAIINIDSGTLVKIDEAYDKVVINQTGERIVLISRSSTPPQEIKIIDSTGNTIGSLGNSGNLENEQVHFLGNRIFTLSKDGIVRMWSHDGDLIYSIIDSSPIEHINISQSSSLLLTRNGKMEVKIWEIYPDFNAMIDLMNSRINRSMTETGCLQYLGTKDCSFP